MRCNEEWYRSDDVAVPEGTLAVRSTIKKYYTERVRPSPSGGFAYYTISVVMADYTLLLEQIGLSIAILRTIDCIAVNESMYSVGRLSDRAHTNDNRSGWSSCQCARGGIESSRRDLTTPISRILSES